jgi:hypothetical protein
MSHSELPGSLSFMCFLSIDTRWIVSPAHYYLDNNDDLSDGEGRIDQVVAGHNAGIMKHHSKVHR